ncbi:MAG: UDP-N-acetylmuramoyl-tripeptide--D-alanyl-D-alanine ligase [Bacillota bacterium]|nr:UDP-N-acetylmuramoyl-tripeptide--D-alanyl-D-alanine ligase [Bacillota bacterium]
MKKTFIEEIIRATNGELIKGDEKNYITGVKHDSRECESGDMFVAIKGDNQDGHKYIPQVVEKGCNTVFVSHTEGWYDEVAESDINIIKVDDTVFALGELAKYYLSTLDVLKIAVTGSVGKTSVRDMIYYALSEKYTCGRNLKNYNNFIGLPISIFRFDEKTEAVVLEMGMDKFGEIDRLASIVKPNIAVITNIGMSHIENLGSREGIFKAKMEVAPHITGRTPEDSGILIFPCDDEFLTRENTKGSYSQKIVGEDGRSDYIISDVDDFGLEGIQFNLEHLEQTAKIRLNIPGRHNSVNAALALAVAGAAGVSINEAQQGLLKTELTGSRLKNIKTDKLSIIDDTYNANPDSMKSAAKVLELSEGKGRKIAILGDMFELGEESERQHYGVGLFVRGLRVDALIAIGDKAEKIAEGAAGGNAEVAYYKNKEDFFKEIDRFIGNGDIILVKGSRGMKMEQIVEKLTEF